MEGLPSDSCVIGRSLLRLYLGWNLFHVAFHSLAQACSLVGSISRGHEQKVHSFCAQAQVLNKATLATLWVKAAHKAQPHSRSGESNHTVAKCVSGHWQCTIPVHQIWNFRRLVWKKSGVPQISSPKDSVS